MALHLVYGQDADVVQDGVSVGRITTKSAVVARFMVMEAYMVQSRIKQIAISAVNSSSLRAYHLSPIWCAPPLFQIEV